MSAQQYVLVRTWVENGEMDTWAGIPVDRETAMNDFARLLKWTSVYGPHTGNKVRVMTVKQWRKIAATLDGAS